MAVSKSHENPLLGHARMRAMYRALTETRALSRHAGKKLGLSPNLEACWVGTAIDLRPGDLSSGAHTEGFNVYIRAIGARKTDRGPTLPEFKRAAARVAAAKPFPGSAADGLCCAIGQAQALAAAAGKNIALAYVDVADLTPAEWKRLLTVANGGELPLIIVTIPAKVADIDLHAIARKLPGAGIPVIAVDAGDAVALFRVMQETSIRARADGGVVVIECVRTGTDPVRLLATQLRKKGICSDRWLASVEQSVHALAQSL